MKRVKIELEDEIGGIYVLPSLVYAREYLGISRKALESVLDRDIRVEGFLIRTSEAEDSNEWELPRLKGRPDHHRLRQEVVAWQPGVRAVRFPSLADAARTAGCREVTLRQAMSRSARAGGWLWCKAGDFNGECEDWFPGMPVDFRFKLNARIEGRPPERVKPDGGDYGETDEQREWRRHGCANNDEWHDYLKAKMEEVEFAPPLAEPDLDDYGIF